MKVDYSKGIIYKITNDYNSDIYIGSTCDTLAKRFSYHNQDRKNTKKSHLPLYQLMNDIGFDRFRIELIENFPSQDKYELRQKEGQYIRQLGTLNKRIEGRTIKEYKIDNKEELKEKDRQYYIKNKETMDAKTLEYYRTNRDKFLEKNNEKIPCECGCMITRINISRHKKGTKHINLMNDLNSNII